MIDVLLDQQFGGGILPGLPEAVQAVARVAHKTGDISTVVARHRPGLPAGPPALRDRAIDRECRRCLGADGGADGRLAGGVRRGRGCGRDVEIAVVNAGLPIVDGLSLPASHRDLLKPAERVLAADGEWRELPRYFYEVASWTVALETPLTAHFGLWEFMDVDLREAPALRAYPRFIPCAVTALAAALEVFRIEAGAPVRIAANGGYRSPSHGGNRVLSPHSWAAAANIYRIGAELARLGGSDRTVQRAGAPVAPICMDSTVRDRCGHGRRPSSHRPRLCDLGASRGVGA